jgi:hypothetical protein
MGGAVPPAEGLILVEVTTSLHPQNLPGDSHVDEVGGIVVNRELTVGPSLQPQNLPGVSQVVVMEDALAVGFVVVVVVLSLHPNQPGVLHVVVVVVGAGTDVGTSPVVVWSKHPHQPGVWHVEVRVRVRDVVVGTAGAVDSVPLLSYIFQGPQSRQSGVRTHLGTSSYLRITSWMTDRILCVPIPTRHPLSATTS